MRGLGAKVSVMEPDVAELFETFPEVAQYPTHWQHDLILPYQELPSYEALQESGLEEVLNYDGRLNVVSVFRGSGGGPSLILNGHVDTVRIEPAREWTCGPFGAEIENGLMFGRGTSDMKGGLMAALSAMTCLRDAGATLEGDVIFQSVVNEEHAGNGTLDLVRRGYKADAAIVLEPTNNAIALSHAGGVYWQVSILGRRRSPGARWRDGRMEGVSAIEKLPAIIEGLFALEGSFNAGPGDDAMKAGDAPFSMVIGKVSGGHYETVTAGAVTLSGGAYFSPALGNVHDVMQALRETIAAANRADDFLSEHPARLEFLHHDDAARQSSQIPFAVHVSRVLAERAGNARIRPGPFA